MAKLFQSGKWKKRLAFGTSLVMATTLALGVFAACKTTDDTDTSDEEENAAMPADSQLLKNGNFEFYSEMTKEEKELKNVLNTPSSWSFSSGSPSSDTRSGLIDLKYWESITGSKHEFTDITDAYTNWDEGSMTSYSSSTSATTLRTTLRTIPSRTRTTRSLPPLRKRPSSPKKRSPRWTTRTSSI